MNSVQIVTLNSALSQNWVGCKVRTPRTQVVRTLHPQCPCRGRCCAHSKLVGRMSCSQPTQVARSAYAGRTPSAQVVGACRDLLPLPSPRPGRDIISRSRPPRQLSQVATSVPCRDLPSAQPIQSKSRPQKWGRNTNFHGAARTMSRHQSGVATPLRPLQVATSKRGRDTVSPAQPQARSRHRNQVATLLEANLCRDINFMS